MLVATLGKMNFENWTFGCRVTDQFSMISMLERVCLSPEAPVYRRILWPQKFYLAKKMISRVRKLEDKLRTIESTVTSSRTC